MMNKMMKKAAIVIGAAAMAIASMTCAVSAAECNKQGYVTAGSYLNVRTAPSADAKVVGTLQHGEGVIIIDTNDFNGWTKIGFNGGERYVSSRYISENKQGQTCTGATDDHGFKADSNIATQTKYAVKVAKGTYLALRNDFSSSDAFIIDELYNGDTVTVIEGNGKFWYVSSDRDGRAGYVNSNYLVAVNNGQDQTYTGATDDHGFKADSNVAVKKQYTVNVAKGTYLALRNDLNSSDSSIIDELYNGEAVTVIEGNGKFWLVCGGKNGNMGYVNNNYLV